MSKLNGVQFNNVKGNGNGNQLKAKVSRNVVAIANEKGLCVVTNNADYTAWYQCDSIVDAALEGLVDLLESIPENTDGLVEKPFRVILPKSISGLATGSFCDYIRTRKSITDGKDLPEGRLEAYAKVMKLMATRYANVELVADGHTSKFDKEVREAAWNAVKAEVSNRVRGISAPAQQQAPASQGMSDEDKVRLAELKSKIAKFEDQLIDAESEEEETKIENKIAKVQSAIERLLANCGQKAVEEDTEEAPQVADDIASVF